MCPTPCSNPWESLSDDAQLSEEEIEMIRQPSHGTRTSVLGVPSLADIDLRLSRIEQSIAALGALLADDVTCGCPECENKTFDTVEWGD